MNHKEIERWYRLQNLKKTAQILVAVSILVLAIGLIVSRFLSHTSPSSDIASETDAGSRIGKFSFSVPGPHSFEVVANGAIVSKSLDKVVLEEPRVTYHPQEGEEVVLTAETGELNRTTQSYSVKGNVDIKYGAFQVQAADMEYSHEKRLASTSSPFSMKSKDMVITGKGLKLWMEKEEAQIERDVEAWLFNVKLFEPKADEPK